MDHPEAPSAPPLEGRHQRPGKAGSAVARAFVHFFHAERVMHSIVEN